MSKFKYDVSIDRVGSHLLVNWSNPIVGFGSFDICTESGMVFCDEICKEQAYKIINDWIRPVNCPSNEGKVFCYEDIEYNHENGIVVTYIFKNEETGEYDRNKIVIVSNNKRGTLVYQGLFRYDELKSVYEAKRYVKEYLASCGITVLQR